MKNNRRFRKTSRVRVPSTTVISNIGAILTLVCPAQSRAEPIAHIEAARTSCVAPCAVFFDGRGTTDTELTGELVRLNLVYQWNFGDPTSGYWNEGVARGPKNMDLGFVAGHVYETPGTYTVTLQVSDGTITDTDSVSIAVTDPVDEFGDDQIWCFANTDDETAFAECPTEDPSHRLRTEDFGEALNACGAAEHKAWCLFRAGDTFQVSSSTELRGEEFRLIQSYGPFEKANLEIDGSAVFGLSESNMVSNITVADLNVQGTDSDGDAFFTATNSEVQKLFLYRINVTDAYRSVALLDPGGSPDTDTYSDQVALVEVSIQSRPNLGGNDVFIEARRLMILGCRIGNAEGDEHNIRFSYVDGAILAHGWYGGGCGPNRQVVKLTNTHHDLGEGCGTNPAHDFILADSYIYACPENEWVVTLGPNSSRWFETLTTYVAERNVFDYGSNSYEYLAMLLLQGPYMVARHNIFRHNGINAERGTSIGVNIRALVCSSGCGDCPTDHPLDDRTMPINVQIYNNTFYSSIPGVEATMIGLSEHAENALVMNNLAYVPDSPGFTMVEDSSPSATYCDSGSGIGDCNIVIADSTENPFGVSDPVELEEFVVVDKALTGTGEFLTALKYDITGRCFPEGAGPNVGATWLDGEDCLDERIPMGVFLEINPESGPAPLSITMTWTVVNEQGSVSCDVDCGNGSFDITNVSSPYSGCSPLTNVGPNIVRLRCTGDDGPIVSSAIVNVTGESPTDGGHGAVGADGGGGDAAASDGGGPGAADADGGGGDGDAVASDGGSPNGGLDGSENGCSCSLKPSTNRSPEIVWLLIIVAGLAYRWYHLDRS